MLETFKLYSILNIKNPSFSVKMIYKKIKSPSAKVKGLVILMVSYINIK